MCTKYGTHVGVIIIVDFYCTLSAAAENETLAGFLQKNKNTYIYGEQSCMA